MDPPEDEVGPAPQEAPVVEEEVIVLVDDESDADA